MNKIENIIQECRELKKELGIKNKELSKMKNSIRLFMIDSGIPEIDGVTTRRSFSFDIGILEKEYPQIAKAYTEEETITTTTINKIIDKKGIEKYYPDEYKKCVVEGTVKLYGL